MKYILFAVSLFCIKSVFAQKEKSITVYTNAHSYNYFDNKTNNTLDIGFISAAYQIKKNKKRLTYELAKFNINRDEEGTTQIFNNNGTIITRPLLRVTTTQLAGRLIYSKDIIQKKNINVFAGLGATAIYASKNIIPFVSNLYPIRNTQVGVTTQIQMGVKHNLFKRLFIDAQALLPLATMNYQRISKLDAALTQEEQKVDTINLEITNKDYTFRIGLGYYL